MCVCVYYIIHNIPIYINTYICLNILLYFVLRVGRSRKLRRVGRARASERKKRKKKREGWGKQRKSRYPNTYPLESVYNAGGGKFHARYRSRYIIPIYVHKYLSCLRRIFFVLFMYVPRSRPLPPPRAHPVARTGAVIFENPIPAPLPPRRRRSIINRIHSYLSAHAPRSAQTCRGRFST